MIGKKTNEIAVVAKEAAGGGAEIGEKANENASFQFSVSSVQPGNEKGEHLFRRREDAMVRRANE